MQLPFIKRILSQVSSYSQVFKTSAQLSYYRFAMSGDCKPSAFFILGAPGSGKGTQCAKIIEKYNIDHFSAGDLLREEMKSPGSTYGALIDEHLKNGTIVPAEITCSLLEKEMHASRQNYFLIDGFPRNKDNVDIWEKKMSEKVNILGVLFFDCSEDVCIKRCLSRGAAGSGRSDDNEECLKKRFVIYKNLTMPVINYYKDQQLVYILDGNKTPVEVFKDVEKILQDTVPLSVKK